jgi:glycosyltransferase involved in cell wall biosynthesis
MSRILTVFSGYGQGQISGAERMAWRTMAALALRGHDMAALTDSPLPHDLRGDGLTVFRSRAELTSGTSWSPPDVVHGYDLGSPGDVMITRELAQRWAARFVLTPASAPQVWPEPERAAALCRVAEVIYTLTGAEADALTAMGVDPTRLRTLPQAPDLRGNPNPAAFRARHGIRGHLVLFLGRRIATKGYEVLLDAAASVWEHMPDTVFAFAGPIGDGVTARAFRTRRDPRILDLGMPAEQEKHDALAACTVLCLPTIADVFPLVFVEAWACGKPVVSGRFAGVDEVVRHGVDGIVVDARPSDVAEALRRLLPDSQTRRALGAAGLRRVRADMSWARVAELVEDGYRSVPPIATNIAGGHSR